MTPTQIWTAVLSEFELKLSKPLFKTWMGNTALKCFDGGQAIVCVPSDFIKEYLEKKFHQEIIRSIERISGSPIQKIVYRVEQIKGGQLLKEGVPVEPAFAATPSTTFSAQAFTTPRHEPISPFGLNPRLTFKSFVVGKNNELAHAAAQAVVSRPGVAYNPLFLYGGVGLGKTHLLHAIGNEFLALNPQLRVLYAPCERFVNDFINAVREGHGKEFKELYRSVDLLLIDDIQFIAKKMETQEEFFHTFNALHQLNKQLVLSSDRPPKSIPTLEDRLRSRLEWGMIADVTPPDLETRVAILHSKCIERGLSLNPEILTIIAGLVSSSVRELEGALNKIMAHIQIGGIKPDEAWVRSLLSRMETEHRRSVTPKEVVQVVAKFFDITHDDVLGESREKRYALPRQIIMYLLRTDLGCSFPQIGLEIGNRDHTTAMHAHEKIGREVERDAKIKQDVATIKQLLYQSPL